MTGFSLGPLRAHVAFRWFWAARLLSLTGDGVALVALVLYIERTEGSAVAVSGLLLAHTLPRVASPLGGTLADRVDRRRLMVICESVQGGIYALIALLLPSYAALLLLVATAALFQAVLVPAGRACLPSLVAAHHLASANALLALGLNLYLGVGPLVGGLLVATTNVQGAVMANAVSFLVAALALRRLPPLLPRGSSERSGVGMLLATKVGIAYALRNPTSRAVTTGLLFGVAFLALDNVALVFLVKETLGGGPAHYGAALSAFGLGMLAASLAVLSNTRRLSAVVLFPLGLAVAGIGTLLTGIAPVVVAAIAAQAFAGAGNGLETVGADTLIQERIPDEMLGRVFGVTTMAAFAGNGVAYALGGVFVDLTSPRVVFVTAGLGVLGVLIVVASQLKSDTDNVEPVRS